MTESLPQLLAELLEQQRFLDGRLRVVQVRQHPAALERLRRPAGGYNIINLNNLEV